jgi:hypothetical protein
MDVEAMDEQTLLQEHLQRVLVRLLISTES